MMSLALPPRFEIFALGCGARGACCAGAVPAVAGCSDSRIGKLSVLVTRSGSVPGMALAGGLGSAASGFGGNGFGADAMPNGSCSALASPIARGGDASTAAAAVAGASCIGVAAVRGSLGPGE